MVVYGKILIGLVSSVLAVIDPNSFGLVNPTLSVYRISSQLIFFCESHYYTATAFLCYRRETEKKMSLMKAAM